MMSMARTLLYLFILGLGGAVLDWLPFDLDLTQNRSNSLSPMTQSILKNLNLPLVMTLQSGDPAIHQHLNPLLHRVRGQYPKASLTTRMKPLDGDLLGQSSPNILVLEYGAQRKILTVDPSFTEERFSDALYALSQREAQWVVFLDGHQERDPFNEGLTDLGQWTRSIQDLGIHVTQLNLADQGLSRLPDNTKLLVIANPQTRPKFDEIPALIEYLDRGGHLLWMIDDEVSYQAWLPLAKLIGFSLAKPKDGFKYKDPHSNIPKHAALIHSYPDLALFRSFKKPTYFPEAQGLYPEGPSKWKSQSLLQATTSTPPLTSLSLGFYNPSQTTPTQFSIIVVGNSLFLTNQYIDRFGNRLLGKGLINGLTASIPWPLSASAVPRDLFFKNPPFLKFLTGWFFPFVMPFCLLALVWLKPRQATP